MIKNIEFRNNLGLTLRGFVHIPKSFTTAVLYLHGFPSHCDSSAKRVANALSKRGFLVMRFDFSGTDTSDGRFEDKLMSREVKDIKYAIDFLCKNYSFRKLAVIGHSTGAIDLALYAHTDRRIDRVIISGGLAKLYESAHYDFSDVQVRDFWRKGHIVYNRPGKWMHKKKLKKAFYDEFFTLDVESALRKIRKPILIIHGECDEGVSMKKNISELVAATHKAKVVIVPNADHRFTKRVYFSRYIAEITKFMR